jgi:hypothetical protein
MASLDEAVATQIRNIETTTGRSIPEWTDLIAATGLEKHGQIISYLKSEHQITHGNANLLATKAREALAGGPPSETSLLDAQYTGAKAPLRGIHDALVAAAGQMGSDVETVIQKTGVSVRRSRQFAVIRAASSKRVELGLNLPGVTPAGRLLAASGMCSHRIDLQHVDDVDGEVIGWMREAYEAAG